jgi:hypothetical protein
MVLDFVKALALSEARRRTRSEGDPGENLL